MVTMGSNFVVAQNFSDQRKESLRDAVAVVLPSLAAAVHDFGHGQIVGILGYKNDSPFSLGRHYRDVLSASIMISNDRINAKSAAMLLVSKDLP